MKPGERINLEQLECVRYSHYEKVIHHEETITVHRYVFRAANRDCFVYAGVNLCVRVGDIVDIRCTVKRDERMSWGSIRIARVKLTGRGKRELLL